ncbi:MAG: sigma-70 family RNA polymerase sigma factor [Gemmataceae bacterium]|nr:sigma-70 family RNA polymerase sigma factor [Gemmataceae bacterium]
MQDSSTSLSLLERVRDRNQAAWSRLVYLYSPLIHHWCHSWGVPPADADDLRQEVFQSVATALDKFHRDRPGDTFRGWLRVITRRKFLDHCRRRQGQPAGKGGTDAHVHLMQVPEAAIPEGDDPPEQVQSLHHRALELVRSEFEERTWQAFWRSAVEGQAPVDVARDMSMSPAAVRKAKSRVLRRLKEELGEVLG